mmetsp:Transcript_29491/g.39230  ORF Transcript_29491/g.39230 Transcript_29491/m.39230 type:complete len:228 (+) Transcript_29491:644-1327(+)
MSATSRNSVTGRSDLEAFLARKQNAATLQTSSVKMKFPENSAYNNGKSQSDFKPNQNKKELLSSAKKADFQGQLLNSSVRFTLDENNNRLTYNNCAGGSADKDLVYNIKASRPAPVYAESFDKQSKNHLTQMATVNAGQRGSQDGQNANPTTQHYQTITDSYFNKSKSPSMNAKDVELLKNHYKFHKGTTYSIGHEREMGAGLSSAADAWVAKQREDAADILPGRRN